MATQDAAAVERLTTRCNGHKDADEIREALRASGGDEDAAFEWLFTGAPPVAVQSETPSC